MTPHEQARADRMFEITVVPAQNIANMAMLPLLDQFQKPDLRIAITMALTAAIQQARREVWEEAMPYLQHLPNQHCGMTLRVTVGAIEQWEMGGPCHCGLNKCRQQADNLRKMR